MNKYSVTVENWKGVELDHRVFPTKRQAVDYIRAEWEGTDAIAEVRPVNEKLSQHEND